MASSFSGDSIYKETAWWETEDDDVMPHYSKAFHETAHIADTAYLSSISRASADTGSSCDKSNDFIEKTAGYIVTTQYMYSPRTEHHKFILSARCPSEKVVSYFIIYASSETEAIIQCLKNHWLHNDLITNILSRNRHIYDELNQNLCEDFNVSWNFSMAHDTPRLSGYIYPKLVPIEATIEQFLDGLSRNITADGKITEIIWNLRRVTLPRKDMTVLGFLRTNVPKATRTDLHPPSIHPSTAFSRLRTTTL